MVYTANSMKELNIQVLILQIKYGIKTNFAFL